MTYIGHHFLLSGGRLTSLRRYNRRILSPVDTAAEFDMMGCEENFCGPTSVICCKLYKIKQYPTKQQQNSHLPHISQTILVRQAKHAGHRWRIKCSVLMLMNEKTILTIVLQK